MNTRHLLLLVFFCALVVTCDDDDDVEYPDLDIYVERFIEEAQARGWNFNHAIVDAVYVETIKQNSQTFCGWGYSNYNGTGKRRIEISKTCKWADASDEDREILAFHELGHAVLNRSHNNQMDCNQEPVSIMNQIHPQYKSNETEKRKYYLDELFDQLTARDKCIDYGQDFKIDPRFYQYTNSDKEWYFYSSNSRYTGLGTQALSIACTDNTTTETGYWYRTFETPAIPNCAAVTLRVKMNSSGLTGKGVAIAVRVYENEITNKGASTIQTQFSTTENTPITGVLNNHFAEVVIPCLSMKTTAIVIFGAMMPGTTGQVSFDDIQLLVKE